MVGCYARASSWESERGPAPASRALLHPTLSSDPANRSPSFHIDEPLIVRQICGPVFQTGVGQVRRLWMRVLDRAEERLAATPVHRKRNQRGLNAPRSLSASDPKPAVSAAS